MSIVQDHPHPADEIGMEPERGLDAPTPQRDRDPGRWFLRFGWMLMILGLLVGGFLVYQLWGTGIETAREQNRLGNEFEEQMVELAADILPPEIAAEFEERLTEPGVDVFDVAAEYGETITITDPDTGEKIEVDTSTRGFEPEDVEAAADAPAVVEPQGPVTITVSETVPTTATIVTGYEDVWGTETIPSRPTTASNWFKVNEGDAIARIQIPAIGVDSYVVAGTMAEDIKDGPGHYPGSPLPGQWGNSVLFGHRTTHGAVFYDLDKMLPGHQIFVTLPTGDRYVYQAIGSYEIPADSVDQAIPTSITGPELTLITCTPKYTTRDRLVVNAQLMIEESDIPWEAPPSPISQYVNLGQRAITEEIVTGSTVVEREVEVDLPDLDADLETDPATTIEASEITTGEVLGGGQVLASGTVAPSTTVAADGTVTTTETDGTITVTEIDGTVTVTDADESEQIDYEVDPASGWFHDPAAWPHLAAWALLGILIIAAAAFALRRIRRTGMNRWAKIAAGTGIVTVTIIVFLPTLYEFYVNVARLVPEGI